MRRLLILVAALAVLTTACKIEINAEFVVNADKSGQVVIEMGYDDEVAEFAQSQGSSPDEMFSDFGVEDMPGAEVATERRGDMTFTIVKVPVDDLTAADDLGGDLAAGLSDDFQITFTDDLITVRGATTLDDALGEGGGDDLGISPAMMAEFFSVNIRVTLPGKILDHNATSQSGNTLTWAVDLTGGSLDIFAESNPNAASGGSSSIVLYVVIAAAVILAGFLLWMFMKKKSGSTGAPVMTAPPAPPADDTAPPAPPPSE